ncbi:hypothetical protein HMPREF0476_0995 [Kingella kingae ATCC 23330]|uniref:Uncharacterized protein n=1 Tax=Kingella kingae ATCC 23330 TaxID=887327 RepID=F5S712_KINKI|nr:hypothetical protein HMPREF0476_0995 [Kingella kingae ATCC 23330]
MCRLLLSHKINTKSSLHFFATQKRFANQALPFYRIEALINLNKQNK